MKSPKISLDRSELLGFDQTLDGQNPPAKVGGKAEQATQDAGRPPNFARISTKPGLRRAAPNLARVGAKPPPAPSTLQKRTRARVGEQTGIAPIGR